VEAWSRELGLLDLLEESGGIWCLLDLHGLVCSKRRGSLVMQKEARRWCSGMKHGGAKKLHGQSFFNVVRWLDSVNDLQVMGCHEVELILDFFEIEFVVIHL
jgi:hypothetical protein